MSPRLEKLIVFSDLDGTLLDHDSYSWAKAQPALEALKAGGIPLVLASSKTAAEIAPLRAQLGFGHCPAIVENGAGVLPAGSGADDQDVGEYRAIRDALDTLPAKLRGQFTGFGDMGIDGIVEATGLAEHQAELAARRAFSEPGLWTGSEAEQNAFESLLAANGISARSGGRFLTLSFGRTKAGQMAAITDQLFDNNTDVTVIALGDAPNDMEMLLAADRGFIIDNPHAKPIHFPPDSDQSGITRVPLQAPAGWNQAVLSIVSPS